MSDEIPTKTTGATKDLSLSIVKAAAILRIAAATPEGHTLTEIASRTCLSTTVCFRMLATLELERLVQKDASTGRYRVGLGLVKLARHALDQPAIESLTRDMMLSAAQTWNDVALLFVQDDRNGLCVARREGSAPVLSVGTHIGSTSPLHCGGGPFAILAFSPDHFVDDYLSRDLEKISPRTVIDKRKVRARIQEARMRGYTVGDEDLYEYVIGIGVPIFGSSGALLGSISVGGVKARFSTRRTKNIGEWLVASARNLRITP